MDNFKNRPQRYLQGRIEAKILFDFAANRNKMQEAGPLMTGPASAFMLCSLWLMAHSGESKLQ